MYLMGFFEDLSYFINDPKSLNSFMFIYVSLSTKNEKATYLKLWAQYRCYRD